MGAMESIEECPAVSVYGQGPMQQYGKGGALMVAAAACLVVNDALCKWLMPQYPAGQIMAIRGAVMLVIFLGASLASNTVARGVTFRSKKIHALRGGLIGLSALLFLSGLSAMPLANAVALSFTSPLAVAAFSAPMLGERVEAKRWLAIGVGFLGVLLILNPSLEHYGPASVLPVLAGLAIALSDLLTRRMSTHETSVSISLSTALGTAVVGGCTFAFGWRWPDQGALIVVAICQHLLSAGLCFDGSGVPCCACILRRAVSLLGACLESRNRICALGPDT